jgi:glycosyltransferase involved in cell wall biosynthesis
MIRGCSSVLSISVFSRSVLARRAEMSAERVAVVPAPVTPELARIAATSARDLGGRASQLLTVSRLDPKHRYKGHFEIAQSFGQVVEQRPDARWVVVGDGEDLVTLQGQCDRLGIARSVEFMGHTTDSELARLYAHSCGLVMPSVADIDATPPTGEGFGLVYAEAGAFGTPSIASTASGGSGEFVVDGRTGLTVPPGHRDALALAMARLLADEGLRERLGAEARQRVLSDHTPERFQAAMRAALLAPDNSQRATGGARLPREARR